MRDVLGDASGAPAQRLWIWDITKLLGLAKVDVLFVCRVQPLEGRI